MIKNPKLLAVCLIVANVFCFGAYFFVTNGEKTDKADRILFCYILLCCNVIGLLLYEFFNED
jgi:hypothetical protein